jgi:hypothetical protein
MIYIQGKKIYYRGKSLAAIDGATFPFVPYNSINPEKDTEKLQNMYLGSLVFRRLFCIGKGSIQLTKAGKNG